MCCGQRPLSTERSLETSLNAEVWRLHSTREGGRLRLTGTGFKNYRQFTSGGFKPAEIEAAIKNSSIKVHFNLTDFTKWRYSKYASNPPGPTLNNITNWELHTIYNSPGALQRTTFYRFMNGKYQVVPKPF